MLANHAPASNGAPPGDSDYDIILAALSQTARGRAFLHEFALRNRAADSASLLAAIARIEDLLRSKALEPEPGASGQMEEQPPHPAALDGAPPPDAKDRANADAATQSPGSEIPPATPAPRDPFADIRALSDVEKIALFT